MSEFARHIKSDIMSQIIELRITNPEKQRELCENLMEWAMPVNDIYVSAFANVYLAFYYTGQNSIKAAWPYLQKAKKLLTNYAQPCNELLLRMHKQFGVYYMMQGNEYGAIKAYIEGVNLAQQLFDVESECVAYNNLGFAFQRHNSLDEANLYYEKAYSLIKDSPCCDLHVYLLANLTVICILQKRLKDAEKYLDKSLRLPYETFLRDAYANRNECCFYAATGDAEKAIKCARFLKENEEKCADAQIAAFENYMLLFDSMMIINCEDYAKYFLQMMSKTHGEVAHQCLVYEDRLIEFAVKYGNEEQQQTAFRNYFDSISRLQALSDKTAISGVKAKMRLNKVLKRNEALQSEQSKLRQEVEKDALTNLYNRRYLDKYVEMRSSEPNKCLFGIIMLDIDYFKEYNDFYGHIKGDKVLKKLAGYLQEGCTEKINACRFGGDEFICVCDGAGEEEILSFVNNMREKLAQAALPHEKSRCAELVTMSVGIACEYANFSASPYMVLELADKALYEAKHAGRNTFIRKRADDNG